MAVEIVMPRVDMDMSSGRMGRWHAAEGAHVVKGATLFEIETDKAAMEVDAPASGVLKFVAASEGDVLPVGACIGWIVADGETFVPPAGAAACRHRLRPPPATGRSGNRRQRSVAQSERYGPTPLPAAPARAGYGRRARRAPARDARRPEGRARARLAA